MWAGAFLLQSQQPKDRTQKLSESRVKGLTPGRKPTSGQEKSEEQTKRKKSKKLIAESLSVHPWWESNSYLLQDKGRIFLREQDTVES